MKLASAESGEAGRAPPLSKGLAASTKPLSRDKRPPRVRMLAYSREKSVVPELAASVIIPR